MTRFALGLDVLREEYWRHLKGYRLGLLSNQASLDSHLLSAKEVISQVLPGQLKALFGPQHGHGGEDQDNMVETGHSHDRELDIPIFSLYAQIREPSPEMLDLIDILIIDLQDVGTRVYTFSSTVLNSLKAASRAGKRVVIIDADVGLANIDIIFNLRPEYSIRHVVSSEKKLSQVMVESDHGVKILPGGSGFADMTQLSEGEKLNLLSEFETLSGQIFGTYWNTRFIQCFTISLYSKFIG